MVERAGGEKVGGIYYEVSLDTQKMIDGQRKVQRGFVEMERSGVPALNAISIAVKTLAASLALIQVARKADEMRELSARLNVAAGSAHLGAEALRSLEAVSRRVGNTIRDNVDVFARLNQSMLQLGGTQQDTLAITELVGKAIRISGASAQESSSAILQFGQALGSGKLAGDELRSLLETAPYLMRQLADGLGVPIGALRKMGEEGKLTSDVVVNALSKAAAQINSDFAQIGETLATATNTSTDAAGRLNEKLDTLTGTSATLTGIVKGLGNVFDSLSGAISAADVEAAKNNRADHIKLWADRSTMALSYLADVADVVWQTISVLGRNVAFVFQGIGSEIGGIAAQAAAVAQGDFSRAKAIGEAMRADAENRRKKLDEEDAKTLNNRKLWGQRMRQEMQALASTPQPDRLDLAGRGAPAMSRLNAPAPDAGGGGGKKRSGKKFDPATYLEDLKGKAATSDTIRAESEAAQAIKRNDQLLKEGLLSKQQAAEAELLIDQRKQNALAAIAEKTAAQTNAMRLAVMREGEEKIEALRIETLRKIDQAEKTGALNAEQAALSRQKAEQDAARARGDLLERDARAQAQARIAITQDEEEKIRLIRDEAIRQAQAGYQRGTLTAAEEAAKRVEAERAAEAQIQRLKQQRGAAKVDAASIRASMPNATAEDKIALLKAQASLELQATKEAQDRDLAGAEEYAAKRKAIEDKLAEDIAAVKQAEKLAIITSSEQAFGAVADILKAAGKEQSAAYKVMFAASKAFAIAESIVNIQAAMAKAANARFPENLVHMASVAASTANIISTIQGVKYGGGRMYGGAVSADAMYRVNETGQPEMFTAANGRQYMMPNTRGEVTPANELGGGKVQISVQVHNNHPGAAVSVQQDDSGRVVQIAINEVANQISNNSGPVWQAMRGATNIEGRI